MGVLGRHLHACPHRVLAMNFRWHGRSAIKDVVRENIRTGEVEPLNKVMHGLSGGSEVVLGACFDALTVSTDLRTPVGDSHGLTPHAQTRFACISPSFQPCAPYRASFSPS